MSKQTDLINIPDAITVSGSNVGIGTSSIAANTKLIVKAATNQNLEVESSSGKLRLSALNDARSVNVPLQFTSSSFEFLTGNVGIGNSIPSSFNGGANNLVIGTGSGSEGMTIYGGAESNIFFADGTSGSDAYVGRIEYSHAANAMKFYVNNANAMRIDASGNVGIGGTAEPSSTSYNSATLHLRQVGSSSVGSQLRFTSGNSGHTNADGAFISYWLIIISILTIKKQGTFVSLAAAQNVCESTLQVTCWWVVQTLHLGVYLAVLVMQLLDQRVTQDLRPQVRQ